MQVNARTVRAWIAAGLEEPKRGWVLADVQAWREARNRAAVAARAAGRRRRPADETELRGITRTDRAPPDADDQAEPAVTPVVAREPIGFAADVDEQLAAGVRPRTIVAEQEARRRYWLAEDQKAATLERLSKLIDAEEVEEREVQLCAAFRRTLLEFCRRAAPNVVRIENTLEAQRVLELEAELTLQRIQDLGGIPL